jgi:hypothetical protein
VRCPLFVVAVVAGLASGCLEPATLLPAPTEILKLETWKTLPDGQQIVEGKVSDVFHLPLGPASDRSQLVWLKVMINGKTVESPEYYTSSKVMCYVFRARQAGKYHVEVHREFVKRDETALPGTPLVATPPPRTEDASWPARVWEITIAH